jgi:hypothetical protein
MIHINNAYKDDLLGTTWIGEVVDIEDPNKVGRIKVKVFGKFDDIPTVDIPWAHPGMNSTAGSASGGGHFSVPKKGSIVSVKFDQGNIYHPEYFFNQKISDEVKSEISGSYTNAHVLIYDTVTAEFVKVYFTEQKGLMLDYKTSIVNILPDKSIVLENASKKGRIEMLDDGTLNITQKNNIDIKGSKDLIVKIDVDAKITVAGNTTINTTGNTTIKSSGNIVLNHGGKLDLGVGGLEKTILGETFMDFFNKHTHTGNLGAPTSPPNAPMTPAQLSTTVKNK